MYAYIVWCKEIGVLSICGDYYKAEEVAQNLEWSLRMVEGVLVESLYIYKVAKNKRVELSADTSWCIYRDGVWSLDE